MRPSAARRPPLDRGLRSAPPAGGRSDSVPAGAEEVGHDPGRWRLLLPPGAVVVSVRHRRHALDELRSLPPGTPVALVGRRLRPLARRAGVRAVAEYVALPSLADPVALSRVAGPSLRWTARAVLTVPSGVTGWHAPIWAAVRVARVLPVLLRLAPTGDRLLVGGIGRGKGVVPT
jgi:hypothetical protein